MADPKIHLERTSVRYRRRAYDPYLLGARCGEREHPTQWLDDRRLRLLFSDKNVPGMSP